MSQQEKKKSIGGLYISESRSGLKYLSGFINVNGERIRIVAFKNKEKFSETTPDYSIMVSEPLGGGGGRSTSQSRGNYQNGGNRATSSRKAVEEVDDEDIPF